VLGITTPSWGILSTALLAVFGKFTPAALVTVGVACWTLATWLVCERLPRRARLFALLALSLWPTFTDNQLLGMETPFFCLLLVLAERATHRAQVTQAAAWLSAALITRPEAVLFAPCLFVSRASVCGFTSALRELIRPRTLYALCALPLAWFSYAFAIYGGIVPHSAVAKSGWNAEHYDLGLSEMLGQAVLRLSPFAPAEHLPGPLAIFGTLCAALLFGFAGIALIKNQRPFAQPWALFALLYLAFFAIGRGATEASWYAIPSALALIVVVAPHLPRALRLRRPAVRFAAVLVLLGASTFSGVRRGELLASYEEGYGEAANALVESRGEAATRVLIGEIGVYGWRCDYPIVDAAALVSPEVLRLREHNPSFLGLVQATGVTHFVISESSAAENRYPNLDGLWKTESEREFFETGCRPIFTHAGKVTYAVSETAGASL
ncbi:MAG: hypothetical protein AAF368_00545, partial [Planctomycetota bacterium]